MTHRTPKPVWVVAALSLLLGLSLGQIQRLHRQVDHLEHQHSETRTIRVMESGLAPPQAEHLRVEMEILRHKLHAEAERLRALRLREMGSRHLHVQEE